MFGYVLDVFWMCFGCVLDVSCRHKCCESRLTRRTNWLMSSKQHEHLHCCGNVHGGFELARCFQHFSDWLSSLPRTATCNINMDQCEQNDGGIIHFTRQVDDLFTENRLSCKIYYFKILSWKPRTNEEHPTMAVQPSRVCKPSLLS
jgi:hypothetical protein